MKADSKTGRGLILDANGQTLLGYISAEDLRAHRSQLANATLEDQIALTMKDTGKDYASALSEVVRKNPKLWATHNHQVLRGRSN